MGGDDPQRLSAPLIEPPEPGDQARQLLPRLIAVVDAFLHTQRHRAEIAMAEHPSTARKAVSNVANSAPVALFKQPLDLGSLARGPGGEASFQRFEPSLKIAHSISPRT